MLGLLWQTTEKQQLKSKAQIKGLQFSCKRALSKATDQITKVWTVLAHNLSSTIGATDINNTTRSDQIRIFIDNDKTAESN